MSLRSHQDRQKQKQNGKWNNNVGESSNRPKYSPYYVKLAPESPLRKSHDILHDESSYDSFHNYETDICKDSSDDDYSDADSSHTEGYAVVDVAIEYDVPDDSESDDTSSGSSGTDDFTLEAAACYGLTALMNVHQSDDDDSDFIFADTGEDSDGSIDLELGQADYWKCVKCNNKQNNPRFRYCERCYQVRKSLFPPRPRRQKSRAELNRKRKMAQPSQEYSSSEVESESDVEVPSAKKIALSPRVECKATSPPTVGSKNGNQLNIKDKLMSENNKHANSAGELSCNNNTSSDDGDDGELTVSSDADLNQHDVLRKIKVLPSSSIEISKVHVADCSSYSSTTLVKLTPSHVLDYKLENKLIQNVYRQEFVIQKRPSPPNSLDWKDSGVSSCQESSQDLSQDFSPLEDGCLVRSSSSGSTRSFDSQSDFPASQASTQIQQDSDDTDSEDILTRVEEFTQERQGKLKQEPATMSPSSLLCCRPVNHSDSQSDDVNDSNLGLCRFCMVNPKNGVFVHNNCLHLCCCYKCAVKVWKKRKSCPICNCKIKNVTKLFVH